MDAILISSPKNPPSTPMAKPANEDGPNNPHHTQMFNNAILTTQFLKSIAHAGRLMILCRLAEGPSTVGNLEKSLNMSQPSVSKQLSRLRKDGFVTPIRKGRSIHYSLSDERVRQVIATLYEIFCKTP